MISIIIPVYNAARYIEKTLESVCAQSEADWELILVDDVSTDESVPVMEAFIKRKGIEDRCRMVKLDEETGGTAASARNAGQKAARGRYIAYLDADDLWMPDKLHTQLTFMKMKKAAFTFTAYEFGDEQASGTGRVVHVPAELTYEKALSRTVIFTSTVMLDREQLPDTLIEMPQIASEDTASWWKIMKSGVTAYGLNEVLTVYRRPAGSLSSNKLTAVKRIWGLYRNEGIPLFPRLGHFAGWAWRATARRL